jgi:hypothetical protein
MSRFMHGNGIDQVLQGRSQIMDAVADDQSPSLKIGFFGDMKDEGVADKIFASHFGYASEVGGANIPAMRKQDVVQ